MTRYPAALLCSLALLAFAGPATAQDVGPGVCVEAPGYPCGNSSGGTRTRERPWVDPAIAEAERQEQARQRALRKKNRTPFKGVTRRVKEAKQNIGTYLNRVGERDPAVKAVTYEQVSGVSGMIFVPDGGLGNIALARPVNPTLTESKVATDQVAKVGALLNFLKNNAASPEDAAFLADQAAQIMVGGRSYVHISLSSEWYNSNKPGDHGTQNAFETEVPTVSELLDGIMAAQGRIRQSEQARAHLLADAREKIQIVAQLDAKLHTPNSYNVARKLSRQYDQVAADLDRLQTAYFEKKHTEDREAAAIMAAGQKLKRRIEWVPE